MKDFTTPKGTITTPFRLHSIGTDGITIKTPDWEERVTWEKLRYCAGVGINFTRDRDQLNWYSQILMAAQEYARHKYPVRLEVAEVATNLWGIVGIGVDGVSRPIRAYEHMHLNASQGMEHPQRWMAEEELADIRKRTGPAFQQMLHGERSA